MKLINATDITKENMLNGQSRRMHSFYYATSSFRQNLCITSLKMFLAVVVVLLCTKSASASSDCASCCQNDTGCNTAAFGRPGLSSKIFHPILTLLINNFLPLKVDVVLQVIFDGVV